MRIKHILFPTDFSDCSRALNPEIGWVANRFDANVTLLHGAEVPMISYGDYDAPLVDTEYLHAFTDEANRRLAEYSLNLPDNRVRRIVVNGDVASEIKSYVAEQGVDLVMIGTHGHGAIRNLLLGSVATKLLHDLECPVWTHSLPSSSNAWLGVSKIICGLELTREARSLLSFTRHFAENLGASVRILHSVPEAYRYRHLNPDLCRYVHQSARAEIARLQRDAGTDFPVSITEEPAGRGCAESALDEQADLIVIGRGHCQMSFGSLRTHVYDIIRQAPCPVLSYSPKLKQIEASILGRPAEREPIVA